MAVTAIIQIATSIVVAIATVMLTVNAYKSHKLSRDLAELNQRDFVIRNTPQVAAGKWHITVQGMSEFGYRGEIVEKAGAVAKVRKVETYIALGDRLATNGLYQTLLVQPPYEIHSSGDSYTFEHTSVNLTWHDPIAADTKHVIYLYVRITYEVGATGEEKTRVDGAAIELGADGSARVFPFLKPPPDRVEALFRSAEATSAVP